MKDLIGKQIVGFEFEGYPNFPEIMKNYIGKTGTIVSIVHNCCKVKFSNGSEWAYPYPKILDHIIEPEKSMEEIISNMKQLTLSI
jgi:hypothetical protein